MKSGIIYAIKYLTEVIEPRHFPNSPNFIGDRLPIQAVPQGIIFGMRF